jgi:hypothetical protein
MNISYSNNSKCPACGTSFHCSCLEGTYPAHCWCYEYEKVNLKDEFESCLCPNCITKTSEQHKMEKIIKEKNGLINLD